MDENTPKFSMFEEAQTYYDKYYENKKDSLLTVDLGNLSLNDTKGSINHIDGVVAWLCSFPNIESLCLGKYKLTDKGEKVDSVNKNSKNKFEKLPDLSFLKNLRHLYLDDIGLKDISTLENNQGITFLLLSRNSLGKNAAVIGSLTKLYRLDLSKNQLKSIAFLSSLPRLSQLDISNNIIEDIDSLEENYTLQTIELQDNKDIKSLLPLHKAHSLRYIDASYTTISNFEGLSNKENLLFIKARYSDIISIKPIDEAEQGKLLRHLDVAYSNKLLKIEKSLWDFPHLNYADFDDIMLSLKDYNIPPYLRIKASKIPLGGHKNPPLSISDIYKQSRLSTIYGACVIILSHSSQKGKQLKEIILRANSEKETMANHDYVFIKDNKHYITNIYAFTEEDIESGLFKISLHPLAIYVVLIDEPSNPEKSNNEIAKWALILSNYTEEEQNIIKVYNIGIEPTYLAERKGHYCICIDNFPKNIVENFMEQVENRISKIVDKCISNHEQYFIQQHIRAELENKQKKEDRHNYMEIGDLTHVTNKRQEELKSYLNFISSDGILRYFANNHELSGYVFFNTSWIIENIEKIFNDNIIKDFIEKSHYIETKELKDCIFAISAINNTEVKCLIEVMKTFHICYVDNEKIYIPYLLPHTDEENSWTSDQTINLKQDIFEQVYEFDSDWITENIFHSLHVRLHYHRTKLSGTRNYIKIEGRNQDFTVEIRFEDRYIFLRCFGKETKIGMSLYEEHIENHVENSFPSQKKNVGLDKKCMVCYCSECRAKKTMERLISRKDITAYITDISRKRMIHCKSKKDIPYSKFAFWINNIIEETTEEEKAREKKEKIVMKVDTTLNSIVMNHRAELEINTNTNSLIGLMEGYDDQSDIYLLLSQYNALINKPVEYNEEISKVINNFINLLIKIKKTIKT